MKVEKKRLSYLLQKLNHYKNKDFDKLCYLCKLAIIVSNKYDCMITNPPYLGLEKLSSACKEYALRIISDSKSDMFAMFMETDFVKGDGYMADDKYSFMDVLFVLSKIKREVY